MSGVCTISLCRARRSKVLAAGMAASAMLAVLPVSGCERIAPSLAQAPDTANVTRYNRGTKLLGHDSLGAALTQLDSALDSRDSVVRFRSAFNGGWDHLISGMRTVESLKGGAAKVNAALAAIGRDTALTSSVSTHSVAADYAVAELDSSLAKYRTALISNPKDVDAKWNYELALRYSMAAKRAGGKSNKGGQKSKQQSQRANQSKATPATNGKPDKPPSDDRNLSLQQAEQLLDAMGRREQQAAKDLPVPVTQPPQGKDW